MKKNTVWGKLVYEDMENREKRSKRISPDFCIGDGAMLTDGKESRAPPKEKLNKKTEQKSSDATDSSNAESDSSSTYNSYDESEKSSSDSVNSSDQMNNSTDKTSSSTEGKSSRSKSKRSHKKVSVKCRTADNFATIRSRFDAGDMNPKNSDEDNSSMLHVENKTVSKRNTRFKSGVHDDGFASKRNLFDSHILTKPYIGATNLDKNEPQRSHGIVKKLAQKFEKLMGSDEETSGKYTNLIDVSKTKVNYRNAYWKNDIPSTSKAGCNYLAESSAQDSCNTRLTGMFGLNNSSEDVTMIISGKLSRAGKKQSTDIKDNDFIFTIHAGDYLPDNMNVENLPYKIIQQKLKQWSQFSKKRDNYAAKEAEYANQRTKALPYFMLPSAEDDMPFTSQASAESAKIDVSPFTADSVFNNRIGNAGVQRNWREEVRKRMRVNDEMRRHRTVVSTALQTSRINNHNSDVEKEVHTTLKKATMQGNKLSAKAAHTTKYNFDINNNQTKPIKKSSRHMLVNKNNRMLKQKLKKQEMNSKKLTVDDVNEKMAAELANLTADWPSTRNASVETLTSAKCSTLNTSFDTSSTITLCAADANRNVVTNNDNAVSAARKHYYLNYREITEHLYNSNSRGAEQLFRKNRKAFLKYLAGYRKQIKLWQHNPLDLIIRQIKKLPRSYVIGDLGCGAGELAKALTQKVYSFDLVSTRFDIIECNITHLNLASQSLDVAVFCLSLMGTNLKDYIIAANRVLKIGGLLYIVDIKSRFDNVDNFKIYLGLCGFRYMSMTTKWDLFYYFHFKKIGTVRDKSKIPGFSLAPYQYVKRESTNFYSEHD